MTNNTSSDIEYAVMRRVRTVHMLRPFVSGTTLALALALFALWGIGREVWVARVFENAPTDLLLAPRFFADAFLNTQIAVQALSLAAFGGIVWFFRDLLRTASLTISSARV